MTTPGSLARGILLTALSGTAPLSALATDPATREPVAKAVVDVLFQTSEPEIGGFPWGSSVATLATSPRLRVSAGLSARCVADIMSPDMPDCTAFVPTTSGAGFARAYYATSRAGLLMIESKATSFDCARFDDMASPAAGHRVELARTGWTYLRRERRSEGDEAIVETQLFARKGIGVELVFIKAGRAETCGVKLFVSKMS